MASNPKTQIPNPHRSVAVVILSASEGSRLIVARREENGSEMFRFAQHDSTMGIGAWDLELPVKRSLAGDTSKALDKSVVVRVILHGQCILQRKEAI
jgi:hypothetical protein